VALGPKACSTIHEIYQASSSDKHWRFRLIEAISRSKSSQAGKLLGNILANDKLSAAKIEAALGIGRLRAKGQLPIVLAAAEQLNPEQHRGPLLAVGYALARLGREQGLKIIVDNLVVPKESYRWDQLRPGVYAAGKLKLRALRPRIEQIAERADPFVRREAVIALERMRDRKAIPALIKGLKDRVPGVRNAAQHALVALTGFRHKHGYEQWHRWWQANHN
jgi:hypothetical protein